MGRPQRAVFSGRNRGRCLRRFWPPWKSPLLPSALRDELGGRLKGCRVAGAVIEANWCTDDISFYLCIYFLFLLENRPAKRERISVENHTASTGVGVTRQLV